MSHERIEIKALTFAKTYKMHRKKVTDWTEGRILKKNKSQAKIL